MVGVAIMRAALFLVLFASEAAAEPSNLNEKLLAQLTAYSVEESKQAPTAQHYVSAAGHKAIAVAPKAKDTYATASWTNAKDAGIGALEACQLTYEEPCALIGVDENVKAISESRPLLQDMPRPRYSGDYDPKQIPRARPELVRNAAVVNYRSAPGAKAAAFHIQGRLFIVTAATSQQEAEKQALTQCNNDPIRNGAEGMCSLYAIGNRVVLPQRYQTSQSVAEAPPYTVARLSFDTNAAPGVKLAKITATLYMPAAARPIPAMVIISSSGGVIDWIEGYYARELTRHGIAALVVDSFGPRGVRHVVFDQSLVTSWDMENDAFAALAVLQKDARIDSSRIGIMGLSKGGLVAQQSAMIVRQNWRKTATLASSAHVAIVPDCTAQHRNAATTGKPIFFMLAELDDYTPAKRCAEYAERIKAAGNPNIVTKMYKGAHHNWVDTRPTSYISQAQNNSNCVALIEDNGDYTMAAGNQRVKDVSAWQKQNCAFSGAHVGGGTDELKRDFTLDLFAFLKWNGF